MEETQRRLHEMTYSSRPDASALRSFLRDKGSSEPLLLCDDICLDADRLQLWLVLIGFHNKQAPDVEQLSNGSPEIVHSTCSRDMTVLENDICRTRSSHPLFAHSPSNREYLKRLLILYCEQTGFAYKQVSLILLAYSSLHIIKCHRGLSLLFGH
jgi:hypothetical protein